MKTTTTRSLVSSVTVPTTAGSHVYGDAVDASDLGRASFQSIVSGTGVSGGSPVTVMLEVSNEETASGWAPLQSISHSSSNSAVVTKDMLYRWVRARIDSSDPGVNATVTIVMQGQLI